MRTAFCETAIDLALANQRLVIVTGDFGFGSFDRLIARRLGQYLNFGVCEQAMVGIAAGMAIGGLIPVVYAITPFLLDRAWEQIKLDVDQQRVRVVLAGYADYPNDGPTHRETNARVWCSHLLNTRYCEPESAHEAAMALREAVALPGPSFIRLRNAAKVAARSGCGEWPAAGYDS